MGHQTPRAERQVDGTAASAERGSGVSGGSTFSPGQRPSDRYGAARFSRSPSLFDRTQNILETAPELQSEQKPTQDATQERAMSQDLYAPYKPKSKGRSPGTLIPTNLALPAQQALEACAQAHGDLDEFVMHRLGYGSIEQMYGVLYAEQIDALALAFDQKDRGKIFLNGDQTGNGKGRFGAANIIDAKRQGYIPVFVTQKPNLYKSMLEDLADIGFADIQPFFTNNNERIALSSGRVLRTGNAASQAEEMQAIAQQGDLGGYDAIFTTYNQLQSVNRKDTPRREFLRAIVEQCVFIFDESHEAGGSVNKQDAWSTSGAMNRADFVRWLVDHSASAIFMSATATKDPAVMDLYARGTDAVHAVSSMARLENTLKAGGIPLQQMMAAQFGFAGNMLRRERSMENISFQAKVVGVDHEVADRISSIMRAIDQFDRAKRVALKELNKEVRQEAKAAGEDNAIGQSGAKSQNFTSLMHNAIEQGLLAQKAEATVQEAVDALQRGEKPVIAVANTMDAFIGNYVEDRGIRPGEPIDISFGDILARYLERSRDVTITDYVGDRERRPMTDMELGIEGVAAFEYAEALVANSDFSSIPLSSIDYIKHRLAQSGYKADEITGRSNIINYGEAGEQLYGLRPQSQIKAQGKINVVERFNSGQLDVVILNRSGATGINLHASEKYSDQSVRHLIMAQPERDINQVMQMLGRVNRFGQVVEPKITLVVADIPAEKRLGAMLAKKMSSLNANTTGDRESDLTVSNVADFMNSAGEEVVTELLEEQPEINELLSFPMRGATGDSDTELISRVTGRIPLLPLEKQEELYSYIEAETIALIEQKAAMGENVLEADKLDLDARTLATMTVVPKDSQIDSQFTGPVILEVVDAKVTKKPPTQLAVVNLVRQSLDQPQIEDIAQHDFSRIRETSKEHGQALLERGAQMVEEYRKRRLSKAKQAETADKISQKLDDQLETLDAIITSYPVGASVTCTMAGKKDTLNHSYGVVVDLARKASSMGSPGAPTNWAMKVITLEGQQLSLPFSKVNAKTGSGVTINASESTWRGNSIYGEFDRLQLAQRTERQVFTGNLLKAYQKFPQGKFVSFTDNAGNTRQGLLMSESFDISEELVRQPVIFDEPRQVRAFLEELSGGLGTVHTVDSVLAVKPDGKARFGGGKADYFIFIVPKATKVGGRFFLNEDLLAAAEAEFFSVGDRMEMKVPTENLEAALSVLMGEPETQIAVLDEKFTQQVRSFLGHNLPQLEKLPDKAVEPEHSNQLDGRKFAPTPPPEVNQPELNLAATSRRNSVSLPNEVDDEAAAAAEAEVSNRSSIRRPQDHRQMAEKRIARFFHEAGLAEAIMDDDGFHLRIKNEPYIPLVVESHNLGANQEIYLTHYIEVGRDKELVHDGEMVFVASADGYLRFKETAVQNALTGGELRAPDRSFAGIFAKNIVEQGFAEAALRQQRSASQYTEEPKRIDEPQPESQLNSVRGSGRQKADLQIAHNGDNGTGGLSVNGAVEDSVEVSVAENNFSQFESHPDAVVKSHLNPIVCELTILKEEADTITVTQYSQLESLQFQLRNVLDCDKDFYASSMLMALQKMGGVTILDSSIGEAYEGDRADVLNSNVTIELVPRDQHTEARLAEARTAIYQKMPDEVTTELANRIVELRAREEVFGIFSKDWSDELNRQAIAQIIPLQQQIYEQASIPQAQALEAAEAYATSCVQPQDLTHELETALDFANTVVKLQTELDEIIKACNNGSTGEGVGGKSTDGKARASEIVSELESLDIPAARELPESWLRSTALPFDYETTLQAVSEAVYDSARLKDIEAARASAKAENKTSLSDDGKPAMTFVVRAIEGGDPLLSVEAASELPSLSMPMADFRRALLAARYVGDEHLANDIDAVINGSPEAEDVLLTEPLHNQAKETLGLARAKQQKSYADVIVPLASKVLKTAISAELVTRGREVVAFEGKNYSIRQKGRELKVYCHNTDGFIHAKDDIPIQNRNLSKQDCETFNRFSSKSADQLRASAPTRAIHSGLDTSG